MGTNSIFDFEEEFNIQSPFGVWKTRKEHEFVKGLRVDIPKLINALKTKSLKFRYTDFKGTKEVTRYTENSAAYHFTEAVEIPFIYEASGEMLAARQLNIKAELSDREAAIDFTRQPILTLELDAADEENAYVLKFPFVAPLSGDVNTSRYNPALYFAIYFSSPSYYDIVSLMDALGYKLNEYGDSYFLEEFRKAFSKAQTLKKKSWLLSRAPHFVLQERGDEQLWKDLLDLLEFSEKENDNDASMGIFNILEIGFSSAEVVYSKLNATPDIVMRIYNRLSTENKTPFCELITALSLGCSNQEESDIPRLFFGEKNIVSTSPETGQFSSSEKIPIEDNNLWIYLYNKPGLYGAIGHDSGAELPTDDDFGELKRPVWFEFHPMQLVEWYDEDKGTSEYLSAIGIKMLIDGDDKESNLIEFIMGVLTILSFITSIGLLIRGATGLIRAMAIIDITTTGVQVLINIPEIEEFLNKSEEGRWLLTNWPKINLVANLGIMSPILIKGIIKNGPRIIRALRGSKGSLQRADELANEVEDIYNRATASRRQNRIAKVGRTMKSLVKVKYGESELSKIAIKFRKTLPKPRHKGNIAVFEYYDPVLKKDVIKEFATLKKIKRVHAEREGVKWLKENKIPKENVKRIYSELEPCSFRWHKCKNMLQKKFTKAEIQYSFDYPGLRSDRVAAKIRQASIKERHKMLGTLLK